MSRRFHEWLDTLDPGLRIANASSRVPWLGTGVFAVGVMATAAWVPGPREFFQLRFAPALACFLPAFLFGSTAAWIDRGNRLPRTFWGVCDLVSATLTIFAGAAFVTWSRPPGAAVMVALYLLAAAHYGRVHRATLRHPFTLLPAAAAGVAAVALNPDPEHVGIFAVAGPAAVGGAWVVGTQAYRAHREDLSRIALEAALQAQMLEERGRDVSRLESALLRILQTNHDASNALSTALLNADILVKGTQARARTDGALDELVQSANDLAAGLGRLRSLVEETRAVGQRRADVHMEREPVDAAAVARAVLGELRVRHPAVELCGPDASASALPPVAVAGGAASLHRMLENLVLNACEGDGRLRARRVQVTVRVEPVVGVVSLAVEDDGPGFALDELDRPVTGFRTTKQGGLGLGLYTAERLARASGGSLSRQNLAAGGARVSLYLEEAGPA